MCQRNAVERTRSSRIDAGIVLAHLELVADDGHLAVEVLLGDVRVDHPVGFEVERPLEVLVGRLANVSK